MLATAAAYLVKTSVVLTLALIAAAATARRGPAALRHLVLSFALAGLLLLPLLSLLPVGWRSPLVPAWMGAPVSPAAGTAGRSEIEVPLALARPAEHPVAAAPLLSDRSAGTADGTGTWLVGRAAVAAVSGAVPSGTAVPASPRPAPGPGPTLRGAAGLLVTVGWPAGAALLLLRLLAGLAGAVRLSRQGAPLADPAWKALLERFLALVSLRRPVSLKTHPEVLVPLTWGWRRPVVLFPESAGAWPAEERSSALCHELSHVKRADFPVMLLVRAGLALFWWNPLCWVVYREILKAQEIACDEMVLRAGIRPSTYAACLLAFRRSAGLRWSPSAALPGMLGRSSFQERLAAILKHKIVLMEVKMRTKIMLAAALVLAVALVATARPAAGAGSAAAALVPLSQTVTPPPPPPPPPAPDQKAEKEKAKAHKVVVNAKEIGQGQVELVITEGDEVKKLRFDKPLTITRGKDGGALVLSVDGKDIEVLEGKSVRLEIKGGGLRVVREGEHVEIGEGGHLKLTKEMGKDGETVVFYGKADDVPSGEPVEFKVVRKGEPVVIKKIKEGEHFEAGSEPAIAWTIKEGEGKKAVWIGRPGNEDLLKKVQALQEQVAAVKAKKLDLSALEASLDKLEAELEAKADKLKDLELTLEKAHGEIMTDVWVGGDKAEKKSFVWVAGGDKAKDAEGEPLRKVMIDTGKGTFDLVLVGEKGDEGRKAFEKAGAALKKDLPEGYKLLKQDYDADSGAMTFKIATPEGQKGVDREVVKKIVDSVKDAPEIKK